MRTCEKRHCLSDIGSALPTMPGGKVSTNSLSYQMPFSVTQCGM